MRFSDKAETNQTGYEGASNTRISPWLINKSFILWACPEPGSGSDTQEESSAQSEDLTERPELAAAAMKHKHISRWVRFPFSKNKCAFRFVDLAQAGSHEDVWFC